MIEDRALRASLGNETPVWTGAPLPGVRIRKGDYARSIIAVPFIAFAIFWEMDVFRSGANDGGPPMFMLIWGGGFVAVGLYMLFGRFLWDAYQRSRTSYALTADAAIISVGGSINRVYLPTLATIGFEADDDNSGTIVFGDDPKFQLFGRQNMKRAPAFEFVRDAQSVFDLCTKSQRKGA